MILKILLMYLFWGIKEKKAYLTDFQHVSKKQLNF